METKKHIRLSAVQKPIHLKGKSPMIHRWQKVSSVMKKVKRLQCRPPEEICRSRSFMSNRCGSVNERTYWDVKACHPYHQEKDYKKRRAPPFFFSWILFKK